MNWYKKSRALEPGAWRGDPDPHRLPRHQDFAKLPWGSIRQRQDPNVIEKYYHGIHLTDSLELAAIYANGKSNQEDPPVVIELYKRGLKELPDADAMETANDVRDVIQYSELKNILLSESSVEEKEEQIQNLFDDPYFEEQNDTMDLSDIITQKERGSIVIVLRDYLQSFSGEELIRIAQDLLNGNIPSKILISIVNQFRVIKPIGDKKVHAIYQTNRVNLEEDFNRDQYEDMTDEELAEENITRKGDEYFDDDGRLLISIESAEYGWWIEKKIIYQDSRPSKDTEYTYHGTSLSRAKNAFPKLLGKT